MAVQRVLITVKTYPTLSRKYGETEGTIVEFGTKARAELELLEEAESSEITLVFSNGYRLFVPLDSESDDLDSDYDHWYAHDV